MSKPISRRSFLRASALSAGAVLSTSILAACAPQAETQAPAAADNSVPANDNEVVATAVAEGEETVKLVYSHWGSEDEKASTKATLDAFMKANPKIEVEQMYIPESGDPYLQKMSTMAASNTLPDAALFPDGNTLDWALKDMFLDLSDIYTGEHEKVEAVTYRTPDGKIVGVAGAQEIAVLWYNKDMFDEAQMPYPPASAEEAWSWAEFLDVAQKLTADTAGHKATDADFDPQNIDHYGCKISIWDMNYFALMRSNGGDFFSEDWMSMTLDRTENYEAFTTLAELASVHHVQPPYGVSGGIGDLDTSNALLSKKVAMVADGQWALETLNRMRREEGLNFGIGVLPVLKEPVTTAYGGPIIAFKSTEHPAEAMSLVSFIMDPHQTPDYIQGGLWMPNEKRWYTDPELLAEWIDNENHPAEYKTAVVDYAQYVTRPMPIYRMPSYSSLMNIVNPGLESLWLNKATAEEAIQSILSQAQDHFEKNILSLMVG